MSSTRIATTDLARDALYTKVNTMVEEVDNATVHLTGDETIAGDKTLSGNLKITKAATNPGDCFLISSNYASNAISIQDTRATKGTAPSSSIGPSISFYGTSADSYGDCLGKLFFSYGTDKTTSAGLQVYRADSSSSTEIAYMGISYSPAGHVYTYAPTPTDTTATNGSQIATTGWVNSTGNNVVHLDSAETITGAKTFTSPINIAGGSVIKKQNTSVAGGGLVFERADGDSLTANPYIDLYSGKLRFVGVDSGGTTRNPFFVDILNNSVSAVAGTSNNNVITQTYRSVAAQQVRFGFGNGLKIATKAVSTNAGSNTSWSYGITFTEAPVIAICRHSAATTTTDVPIWVRGTVGTSSCNVYSPNATTALLIAIGY